ncbi:branched-chain amino acid ABC transporter permease [Neobacillus sp. PS3-12]|uniref:branched-chain amino acid ABC transporter permease n=1 Tax=Neobacillus sp. PS3-12 TaxID=3070677 RepID=UPI0027DED144|nr:branched-chain amino acid ABC transporter permease [Neobacillus sp. PS3-12]WML52356.1 branched-chain amino acid ABC transporter permease [Neobacillus sp. PS3-12]
MVQDPHNIVSPFSKINFNLGGVTINGHRLFIFIFSFIIISILYFVIQRTKIGIAMRACAFDMETAQLMGIKATTVIVTTFAIGSALAASAGALLAPIFSVYPTMGVMSTMKAFVVVLLGGVGNIPGAIVGGLIIGLVETYAAGYISSEYKDVFAFVIMILILLFKPEGLFGKNVQEKV